MDTKCSRARKSSLKIKAEEERNSCLRGLTTLRNNDVITVLKWTRSSFLGLTALHLDYNRIVSIIKTSATISPQIEIGLHFQRIRKLGLYDSLYTAVHALPTISQRRANQLLGLICCPRRWLTTAPRPVAPYLARRHKLVFM